MSVDIIKPGTVTRETMRVLECDEVAAALAAYRKSRNAKTRHDVMSAFARAGVVPSDRARLLSFVERSRRWGGAENAQ